MNIEKLRKNKVIGNIFLLILSLFAAIALNVDFQNFTGEYKFIIILCVPVFFIFFSYIKNKNLRNNPGILICAVIASFFIIVGKCFYLTDSSLMIWGSKLRLLYFLFSLIGYSAILYSIFLLVFQRIISLDNSRDISSKLEKFFFGKFCLIKLAGIILLTWLPIIILCYPGGVCADAVGEIWQALGRYNYNIQGMTHALYVGFFLKIGQSLLGSYNRGLYLSVLVQSIILALTMSNSLRAMYKRGVNRIYILLVLALYCFTPCYSNFATMTIKDTLFDTSVLLFITFYAEMVVGDEGRLSIKRVTQITLAALGVMLFRSNGQMIFVFAAVGLLISTLFKKNIKLKEKLPRILFYCILPYVLFILVNSFYLNILKADDMNGKEFLSLPFQQTGRYIRDYAHEITDEEWAAIDKVLDTNQNLARAYNPNISDPLKLKFRENATNSDIAAYLKVWAKMFFKHPRVYADAYLNMNYGWFDMGVKNSIRYQGGMDIFYPPRWGDNTEVVNSWYEWLASNPITAFLDTIGVYVWWMFLLTIRLHQKKEKEKFWVLVFPMIAVLIACQLAPCCLLHPRYAFPILFSIPFLTGYLLKSSNQSEKAGK